MLPPIDNEPEVLYEENLSVWTPSVGDMVYVSKLKRNARVKRMGPGKKVQLDVGKIDIFVASADVFPIK